MSDRAFRYLNVERIGETAVASLTRREFDDAALNALGAELGAPIDEDGCRNLVLALGPGEPNCLYSVFLAKLLNLHRRLEKNGGVLILAEVPPLAMNVLQTSGLDRFFRIEANRESAARRPLGIAFQTFMIQAAESNMHEAAGFIASACDALP